ncbi:VWA domain-containing protein [Legionella jordanis]|uniref:von Willebrand factor type A domain protein n=1 Tax=Legionella jordanis TaxID=456 RepID=A0A0W0VB64_9GAMM|nr:vWA domain-containing protein [Legionella jordanis]KTD17345.1 von Willebrand factor type A domain protein [Legionella jordanis]RMX01887.1 VWA domain-containing protein [Legionella jordanis]RMX17677.1 VWA domain-containing protein [Legionella jordanis]VEH11638.1 von Willebrand factor type A domain [Legionella jordanis]
MKHLINNALRSKNMKELLQALGIDVHESTVACHNERIILRTNQLSDAKSFAKDLQNILQKDDFNPALRQTSMADLIRESIAEASCQDVENLAIHKNACLAIFNVLLMSKFDYQLDEHQECFEIPLPQPAYASIFRCLNYKYLQIEDDKIKFNIKEFLKDHKEEIILIDAGNPLLLVHSQLFENKKIFYAQKPISEDEVEVTPYMLVPQAITPPTYHFVLDTSGSMAGEKLKILKKSVTEFSEALFHFEPEARLDLVEFNTTCKPIGNYRRENFGQLCEHVNALGADGLTHLYATSLNKLEYLMQSANHNNVLLFTDGEDTMEGAAGLNCERSLNSLVASIKDSPLIAARNKFFFILYDVSAPEILVEVAEAFASCVIETSNPDFIAALSEKGKLQDWAAERELFSCQLEVTNTANGSQELKRYVRSFNLSGQFVRLEPVVCNKDVRLHIRVTDGNDQVTLEDEHSIKKTATHLPGSAKAVVTFGIFPTGEQNKTSTVSPTLPQFN